MANQNLWLSRIIRLVIPGLDDGFLGEVCIDENRKNEITFFPSVVPGSPRRELELFLLKGREEKSAREVIDSSAAIAISRENTDIISLFLELIH
jgi:hypothetical protein